MQIIWWLFQQDILSNDSARLEMVNHNGNCLESVSHNEIKGATKENKEREFNNVYYLVHQKFQETDII